MIVDEKCPIEVLRADCLEVECKCCTECCFDGSGCLLVGDEGPAFRRERRKRGRCDASFAFDVGVDDCYPFSAHTWGRYPLNVRFCSVCTYNGDMDPHDAAPPDVTHEAVGVAEVAHRLGVQVDTVRTWRKRGVMPSPDWDLAGGPVWRWSTIRAWAIETGRTR